MVHTGLDYMTKYRMSTIFGQIDSGELAARINPINTFDRRGNVIYLDDFEHSLSKWTAATQGTGSSTSLSVTRALSHGVSAKLVTGNAEDDYAEISKLLAYPVLGKMGFEAAIAFDANVKDIFFDMVLYNGTTLYNAQVDVEPAAGNLKVAVPTSAFTTFDASFSTRGTNAVFHVLKLVADFSTGKYVRFIFDDAAYDLSSYTIDNTASAIGPSIQIRVKIVTNIATARTSYVDNVIFTQNEP